MVGAIVAQRAVTRFGMVFTQINPTDFPGSPYASELLRERSDLRFLPQLEMEYSPVHLQRARLRVRVWFLLVLITRVLIEGGQIRSTGLLTLPSLVQLLVLIPCSAFLVWLSWGPHFERLYLRIAPLLLPPFYALIATMVVRAITLGQFEQFAALAVAQIAVYFFAGLKFREAVITNVCLMASFLLTAGALHMGPLVILKCAVVLVVTSVLVTIACRDVERFSRREFLEHALMARMLTRDSLSGLMNRRAFDDQLRRLWLRAQRQGSTMAVCMIDVDHFKRYNDAFGHQEGDSALSRIGALIQEFASGSLDLAARYGGEEFSLILCDTSSEALEKLTERLRQRVQNERIAPPSLSAPGDCALTVSIGAAVICPGIDRTAKGAVQLADEALYQAKRTGRNRVVVKSNEDYRLMRTGKFEALRRPVGAA